jgi:hypothetical protein
MMAHVQHSAVMPMRTESISVAAKTWHFARHAVEMCVAMCLGIVILDPVHAWTAGQVGVVNPFVRFPELSALVLAFNMTLPMVAWMRFRGMDWRLINEMSAAMAIEAVVIVAAYWIGLLPNVIVGPTTSLWQWQHGLMMPFMLVPMLLRLDHYTSGMHHQAQPDRKLEASVA